MARKQVGASKVEWHKHLRSNRSGHNKRVRRNVNQAVRAASADGSGVDWLHYVRGKAKERCYLDEDEQPFEWWDEDY
jgi:hypothetical protein